MPLSWLHKNAHSQQHPVVRKRVPHTILPRQIRSSSRVGFWAPSGHILAICSLPSVAGVMHGCRQEGTDEADNKPRTEPFFHRQIRREAGYCLKVLNDMLESRSSRSFNARNRGPREILALNPRPASPLMYDEHDLADTHGCSPGGDLFSTEFSISGHEMRL